MKHKNIILLGLFTNVLIMIGLLLGMDDWKVTYIVGCIANILMIIELLVIEK